MSERTDVLRDDVERLALGYAQNYNKVFAVRVEWWADFKQALREFEDAVRAEGMRTSDRDSDATA